jgi:NTE family protein
LRAIDLVTRLLRNGTLKDPNYREFFVHMIENQTALNALGASTKLNAERQFLEHLRDIGRETAQRWIELNVQALGERSSIDLRAMFEGTAPD